MKNNLQTPQTRSKAIAFGLMSIVLTLIWISGCNTVSSNSNRPGTMQVKLTDAPALYDSVMIDIQKVEVQNVDSTNGWVTLNDSAMVVNLLDLTNGAYKIIGQKQLDPGTYPQIRLVLGPNNYVVKNGVHVALTVPSGQQSGLKINANATIKADYTYTLLLDFNAAKSIVSTGNGNITGSLILKPVIKATNEAQTGAISGTASPAGAKPVIYGISGADTVSTTFADTTSGDFKLVGLTSGSYSVSFVPADTTYRDTTITGVSVVAGQTQQLGAVNFTKK
ncbi:MAG TPA: DUF4382 domain-containing protein [Balneolales bacterium]|nr:DUF4382 domain-containing protein [Balneolales bacterium]